MVKGFLKDWPKEREIRTAKLAGEVWFQKGRLETYVLEESIYDPQLNTVLTLLTLPQTAVTNPVLVSPKLSEL